VQSEKHKNGGKTARKRQQKRENSEKKGIANKATIQAEKSVRLNAAVKETD